MTSDQFRHHRISMGLSQATLGRLMGLRPEHVCRLETTREPTQQQSAFVRALVHIHRYGLLPRLLAETSIHNTITKTGENP